MASSAADSAVRNYLVALRDPSALRDEEQISKLRAKLESSGDELERLRLRQEIIDAQAPALDRYEDAFVSHAKSWADSVGITERAFVEEGVPPHVLRRAGFRVAGGRGRGRGAAGRSRSGRTRVSSEAVRSAIPRGNFTIRQLQEASGASPAVVRKVVQEEEAAGRVAKVGSEKSSGGPGRSATVYKRK